MKSQTEINIFHSPHQMHLKSLNENLKRFKIHFYKSEMNFLLKNFIIFPLIFLVLLLVHVNTTNVVDNTTTMTTSLHDHFHDDTGDHLLEPFQANGIKNKEFRQCCIIAGFIPWVAKELVCKVSV